MEWREHRPLAIAAMKEFFETHPLFRSFDEDGL
jgi:hypothetical protein